jgi:hypothetical protein
MIRSVCRPDHLLIMSVSWPLSFSYVQNRSAHIMQDRRPRSRTWPDFAKPRRADWALTALLGGKMMMQHVVPKGGSGGTSER